MAAEQLIKFSIFMTILELRQMQGCKNWKGSGVDVTYKLKRLHSEITEKSTKNLYYIIEIACCIIDFIKVFDKISMHEVFYQKVFLLPINTIQIHRVTDIIKRTK